MPLALSGGLGLQPEPSALTKRLHLTWEIGHWTWGVYL